MDVELRPLVKPLGLRRDGGTWTGRNGAVVAGVIGVGPRPARRATAALLDGHDIERVVVVGVAGGVDPALEIGDVVVPALVVERSTGRQHRPATAGAGTLLTCDEAIFDMAIISALPADGVVAVDMETAVVAEECEARGIPWSVYRGISDRPADGLVDDGVAALARTDGSADLPAVARYLARRPWRVRRLARLGADLKKATNAAARMAIDANGGA